jgi:CRISPR-associated protein Cas1
MAAGRSVKPFAPSELKTILHSKRANVYYLEHCRVLVKGGRVHYVTDHGKESLYWNIPIANTTTVLLGTGTSITQLAVRELAKAGVMIGFCGGGGTPLFAAMEQDFDVAWLSPQSEYRPTEYLQHWVRFWFSDSGRLAAAQLLQQARLERIWDLWRRPGLITEGIFCADSERLANLLEHAKRSVAAARSVDDLLLDEARLSKQLFRLAADSVTYGDFTRAKGGSGTDPANRLLDHGNYLAYGLAASATWVLGLPHGLAVMHGKTRRGGLVFDAADLIKDALILPMAFASAVRGDDDQEFRSNAIQGLAHSESLDFMIETLEHIARQVQP